MDIFSKDYLMIPVHSGLHWSLIIVCYANEGEGREPMILHLDSMSPAGGHNSETVTRAIRKYLNKEWQARSNSGDGVKFTAKVMPAYRVNVPRQQNGCDCGVFILAFVERFCRTVRKCSRKRSFNARLRNTEVCRTSRRRNSCESIGSRTRWWMNFE